jgi:hypothetical protein
MTRARDVADTQDNVGGAVAPFVGAKNFALNGSFDIWQRGTSGTVTSNNGYVSADRWLAWTLSPGGSVTLSRQATGDTTNLPFIQYCGRFQRVAGNTNTGLILLGQAFESVNSIPLAGKTITYSFWARAGSNFSASSLGVEVWQTTTTDSSLTAMLGVKTNAVSAGPSLTTSWQRFSFTGTVASTTTQIAPVIFYSPTGTAGANDYFEVTGVQLELGAQSTPFARTGGSIGGELALCQRYYQRMQATSSSSFQIFSTYAYTSSSTNVEAVHRTAVTMRVAPTAIDYGATLQMRDTNNSEFGISAGAISAGETSADNFRVNWTTTGATAGRACYVRAAGSATAFVGFSAEL